MLRDGWGGVGVGWGAIDMCSYMETLMATKVVCASLNTTLCFI